MAMGGVQQIAPRARGRAVAIAVVALVVAAVLVPAGAGAETSGVTATTAAPQDADAPPVPGATTTLAPSPVPSGPATTTPATTAPPPPVTAAAPPTTAAPPPLAVVPPAGTASVRSGPSPASGSKTPSARSPVRGDGTRVARAAGGAGQAVVPLTAIIEFLELLQRIFRALAAPRHPPGYVDLGHGVWGPAHLVTIRACETRDDYGAVSRHGAFRGAYQFSQRTWNAVAARNGRPDLVGVRPEQVSRVDQDRMAVWNYEQGNPAKQWPVCSRRR